MPRKCDKITRESLVQWPYLVWPANSVGDDIAIYDEKTKVEISNSFF